MCLMLLNLQQPLKSLVRTTLQELEFEAVMTINGSLLGKAQGLSHSGPSCTKKEDGNMMAMTTFFANNEFKDGLSFFGLHRNDVTESHIAVIGGIVKYVGANGYATVKVVELKSNSAAEKQAGVNKLLLCNVYLS
ncbi:hypothetical protein REPUB_Repub13aG0068500 [Reevesia pubescens]